MENSWILQVGPLVVALAVWWVLGYVIYGRLFRKAGFSQWIGMAAAIPGLGFFALAWLAFVDWPNVPGPFGTMKRGQ